MRSSANSLNSSVLVGWKLSSLPPPVSDTPGMEIIVNLLGSNYSEIKECFNLGQLVENKAISQDSEAIKTVKPERRALGSLSCPTPELAWSSKI